jgi:predicted amidophosphoribosyltransferase
MLDFLLGRNTFMTDFTGVNCPICGKPFLPGDDIVVCPECGAPYHRACYQKVGHCVFEDKHGTAQAWQSPEEQAAQTESVRCPRCGHANAPGALFCEHCGTSLTEQNPGQHASAGPQSPYGQAPINSSYPPAGNESNGHPNGGWPPYGQVPFAFDPMAGIDPDATIDHVKAGDLCKVVQSNTTYYLPVFMNHEKFHSRRFNFAAFILGGGWLLYRKLYTMGTVITTALLGLEVLKQFLDMLYVNPIVLQIMNHLGISSTSFISSKQLYQIMGAMNSSQIALFALSNALIPLIVLIVHIVVGCIANNLYRKHCVKTVLQVQATVKNDSDALINYQEKGGINTVLLIMVIVCYLIVTNIVNYNSSFMF